MGKGKAAGFHSWADGFAVCSVATAYILPRRADHGEYRQAA
jgi:hypothetical protein